MKQLIILLSFLFVSLGVFTSKEKTFLQTVCGCKLIICTQVPVVEKNKVDNNGTVAADYYQPLSPISRFIILQ